jgi:predicted nucleotidyltransferase
MGDTWEDVMDEPDPGKRREIPAPDWVFDHNAAAKPDSDIDLLVDFLPEASLIDQFRLQEELTKLLKTPVDVISRRSLKPRDHDIRNEAMAL